MRFFLKMVMILVIMLGLSSYGSYLMTGRPLWAMLELPAGADIDFTPELPDVPDSVSKAVPKKKETVYKWRDADGVMQYSNRPPPDGIPAQQVEIDPDANIVAGMQVPEPEEATEEPAKASPATSAATDKQSGDDPALYSPGGVKKLMDDARNVRKQLNDRDRARREAIENM